MLMSVIGKIFLSVALLHTALSTEESNDGLIRFDVSNVTISNGRFRPQKIQKAANVIRDHYDKIMSPPRFEVSEESSSEKKSDDTPTLKFEVGMVNHELSNLRKGRNFKRVDGRRRRSLGNPVKHGFVAAAMTAYNLHLPLELSPDDFWLLIAFSVAQYLGQNETAEQYRDQFVDHEGKKELIVWIQKYGISPHGNTEVNREGWPLAIRDIMNLIIENTNTNFSNIMTDPFSTSGMTELTAFRVALMESMKNYFEYTFGILCGIPHVTLHGTVADYEDLLQRIDNLIILLPDFNWYLSRVRNHAAKLLQSAQGNPDTEWWQNMVKIWTPMGCGGPPEHILSGWMVEWIAYYHDGSSELKKVEPAEWDQDGVININAEKFDYPAVTLTDVKLKVFTQGKQYPMIFSGGFLGVSQNADTGALRPAIGWLTFYKGQSEAVEPIKELNDQ